jgi:hypothetical protein
VQFDLDNELAMKADDHLRAADELRISMAVLDPPYANIRLYAEGAHGRAFHLLCAGADRRFGVHRDHHDGFARWLRERGEEDMAEFLTELEAIRTGRWYGRQGNGDTAERIDDLLATAAEWAMAGTGAGSS